MTLRYIHPGFHAVIQFNHFLADIVHRVLHEFLNEGFSLILSGFIKLSKLKNADLLANWRSSLT